MSDEIALEDQFTFGYFYEAMAICEAEAITAAGLVAAVDAYMADPQTTEFVMSGGFTLDMRAAVDAYAPAVLADPEANMMRRHGGVRRAILLARPAKA